MLSECNLALTVEWQADEDSSTSGLVLAGMQSPSLPADSLVSLSLLLVPSKQRGRLVSVSALLRDRIGGLPPAASAAHRRPSAMRL